MKFLITRPFYVSAIAMFLVCCQTSEQPLNKFSDPHRLKIADFQDRRLADSLYPYLNNPDPVYRRDAVQAFGSLQDVSEIDRIGKLLLMDEDPSVRKAAAFALGQIQDPGCERILLGALVKEKIPDNLFVILQAYGKTTRGWKLDPSLFLDDTLKTEGLSWSVYRAGIRGKTDSTANAVATRLLDRSFTERTRLGAAHYFARGAKDFQDAAPALVFAARQDVSASVRMAAALSLGKVSLDTCLSTLKEIIKYENDSRVIVNAIRALGNFPYSQIKHYLYEALNNKDTNVGIAASELILDTVIPDDWIEVSSLTNHASNWRIQANLYQAALKAGKNKDLAREIQGRYKKAQEPFQRAAFLEALKYFPEGYAFVERELRNADTATVRTAAAATLVAMNQAEGFPTHLRQRFANLYRDLMQEQEDPPVLGSIAIALADSALGHRNLLKDAAFLYAAKEKLTLPEHNEALQSVEAAIAHFEHRKPTPVKNEFNHPIDWELVKNISEDQRATIKTTRGSIIIRLLVNESPGSVSNFIALAQNDYFDNKYVHRVVPNFVIQAGCPRGDGWGGENYSIRSEYSPRRYRAGSVGMASAGKDTEGTQWFITHSPTPHLEGRYTIFAEVVIGQPVVDFLEVGDKIIDVEVKNFTDQ